MVVHSFYVINRSGGLIFSYEHAIPKVELEKTFSYPLDFVLKPSQKGVVVEFGQRDGIKVGHAILSINGIAVRGNSIDFASPPTTISTDDDAQSSSTTTTSHDIIKYLSEPSNFPGRKATISRRSTSICRCFSNDQIRSTTIEWQ